jgi:hypothetical protein
MAAPSIIPQPQSFTKSLVVSLLIQGDEMITYKMLKVLLYINIIIIVNYHYYFVNLSNKSIDRWILVIAYIINWSGDEDLTGSNLSIVWRWIEVNLILKLKGQKKRIEKYFRWHDQLQDLSYPTLADEGLVTGLIKSVSC